MIEWTNTKNYLRKLQNLSFDSLLELTGLKGLKYLREATPKDSGLASNSWSYSIEKGKDSATITFHNDDIEGGYNVAILVQYGHGTEGGGFVQGVDFINPAMDKTFQYLADELWKEVRDS